MNKFYLGGDVSKGYCDFIILDENKKTAIKNFQLDDTAKGHHLLSSVLIEFVSAHPGCAIFAGVESPVVMRTIGLRAYGNFRIDWRFLLPG